MQNILLKILSWQGATHHGATQYAATQPKPLGTVLQTCISMLTVVYLIVSLSACRPAPNWQQQAQMVNTLQQAHNAISARQWQLAQTQLALVRTVDPRATQHAVYWSYLATVESALMHHVEALKAAWKTLQLAPRSFISNNNYAVILCQPTPAKRHPAQDQAQQQALARFTTLLQWHNLSTAQRQVLHTNLQQCRHRAIHTLNYSHPSKFKNVN